MNMVLENKMFKKVLYIFIILFTASFICNCFITSSIVDADSGFDAGYDSGSSGGGSYGSDGYGDGDLFTFVFFGYSILAFIVYVFISSKLFKKNNVPICFSLIYLLFYCFISYIIFGFAYFILCCIFVIFVMYYLISNKLFKNVEENRKVPIWFAVLYSILSAILCIIIGFFMQNIICLIIGIVVPICLIAMTIDENKKIDQNKLNEVKVKKEKNKLTQEQIYKQLGNDFNIDGFKSKAFNMYRDVQIAWMERDVEPVRHMLSDEMLNMYRMQLATLVSKNQKNMMEDIEFIGASIIGVSTKNGKEQIKLKLHVTCRDYIIDVNNKVVRGNRDYINNYTYLLTFVRSKVKSKLEYCPNCGAKLDNAVSDKCEYCDSIIVRESDNFVMTDKKMLSQKVKEIKKYEE